MLLKASLHIHSKEDFEDGPIIAYTINQLIDRAKEKGFSVLALTGHKKYVCRQSHIDYAARNGILLIPGIELTFNHNIRESHVLVLNCDKSIEQVSDFEMLRSYKKRHPESFIIAPHANFLFESMGIKKLLEYIDLFDAIEHSWFYSKVFDLNRKLSRIANEHGKPFVATADMHTLDYLNSDYLLVDSDTSSAADFFAAIKAGRFRNVTRPKKMGELATFYLILIAKTYYAKFKKPRKGIINH